MRGCRDTGRACGYGMEWNLESGLDDLWAVYAEGRCDICF
jgi:hypothetical protein